MEYAILNNGVKIPMEGFGVFQVPDQAQCEQVVLEAIESGYRLIDTAAVYMNEEAVGAAIKKSGVPREELFITTKLWSQDANYTAAKVAFQTSLDKLGLDYIDLYMIHQPLGDYYGAYRALEELYKEGKIKAIGICNFYPDRVVDLCMNVEIKPQVNQIELHPYFQQEDALKVMKEFAVQPQAWGPLAEGKHGIFTDPILAEIGAKYGKSNAQVVLKWNAQRGVIVIPKSVNASRIKENFDIWDFELSQEDMDAIAKMDFGHSEIIDHRNPELVKGLLSFNIH
ncbi:aldo/keto reductase [Trichococcus shcherbakoviae]|uniref:aldo/keto reductase n=1 Tax=Trichococcus shcherbakoviae TaxID=2094020 RepID=UPI002AA7DCD2|nr:aldo/keto reductase [Trichococcus shcherbakoviae]